METLPPPQPRGVTGRKRDVFTLRVDFREEEEDSNFSSFRVWHTCFFISEKCLVASPSSAPTCAPPFSLPEQVRYCYCLWGVPSRPSPGSYPGPVQVPSRVRGGPVQIRHVLCFTVFRTHPGPEVGAIPARPGPILLPSVPYRIGPGRAETDFQRETQNKGTHTERQPLRCVQCQIEQEHQEHKPHGCLLHLAILQKEKSALGKYSRKDLTGL